MANEIVRPYGQLAGRQEASLGSSSGTWEDFYLEEKPAIPTDTTQLVENSIHGYRNPLSRGKPVPVEVAKDSSWRLKQRIRRCVTDGDAPLMTYLFESAGWRENAGSATFVEAGATTTSFTVDAIGSIAAGECVLVELVINSATIYFPVLVAAVSSDTITPSIALPVAPAENAVVEVMNSYTPTSSTGQQVPTNKTMQFRYNTSQYYDDAVADGARYAEGCAASDLAPIEIGSPPAVPMLDWGIHVSKAYRGSDDIDADSFTDSDSFLVVTDDCEFAFAPTNSGSGIATLVSKYITKLTFNPGLKTIAVKATGAGSIGGNQAYVMQNEAPSVTIEGHSTGDAAFDKEIYDQLIGDNSSKYIHWVQPTRDLDDPAFGIWLPNCHIKSGGEFALDESGDLAKFTVTYEADLAAWGGEESPSEVEASPIVLAVNNEAA